MYFKNLLKKMYFKNLCQKIPIDIVKGICMYDNTYVLRMKNVINEIEKLNKDIDEYWDFDAMLYYMTEKEENYRLKLGLPISMEWPLPNKRCFRFWNTSEMPTLEEVTLPRDNWWLYQYGDGCYIYPTKMRI